jgi:hypothetical protein
MHLDIDVNSLFFHRRRRAPRQALDEFRLEPAKGSPFAQFQTRKKETRY